MARVILIALLIALGLALHVLGGERLTLLLAAFAGIPDVFAGLPVFFDQRMSKCTILWLR